jgi:hypothetical protein
MPDPEAGDEVVMEEMLSRARRNFWIDAQVQHTTVCQMPLEAD